MPTAFNPAVDAVLVADIDTGSVYGPPLRARITASEELRLTVGVDSLIFNDSFNYSAQNTANYKEAATTQTLSHATAGYVILNASGIVTASTNSAFQTRRCFPITGGFILQCGIFALHTVAPQANAATEWGLFTATIPGGAIPTDGVYFRFNTSGAFECVVNFNGVETIVTTLPSGAVIPVPAANLNHRYDITLTEETALFFVDDALVADIDTPNGQGQPFASGTLPVTVRHYIGGTPPATAMKFQVADLDVNLGDMNTTKPWSHVMAGGGLAAYQGQNGGTMGSSANYANSANPTAAVPTNTTAALGTGLGGQFWETATLAVNTDGILCSFQNPVGSPTQTPRNLVISGVYVDSYIQTVIGGGPFNAQIALAYGHTAASLATAEAATTKAPRIVPLGVQLVTATQAVNTNVTGNPIYRKFDTPIVVNPGEFVAVITKHVGTVGASGVIAHMIGFDAYFE